MSQGEQKISVSFTLKKELTLLWLQRMYRVMEEEVGEVLRTLHKRVFYNLCKFVN